jgi:hypothetical protein
MMNDKEVMAFDMADVIATVKEEELRELIDLLMNEDACFTKRGRLNKSAVCRMLGCKNANLELMLGAIRTRFEQ